MCCLMIGLFKKLKHKWKARDKTCAFPFASGGGVPVNHSSVHLKFVYSRERYGMDVTVIVK